MLSGHAHLYQRFTRAVDGRQIPYVVSGSGGFSATKPQTSLGPAPITQGEYTLEVDPIVEFGYLTCTADFTTASPTLTIAYRATQGSAVGDTVTVDLTAATIA